MPHRCSARFFFVFAEVLRVDSERDKGIAAISNGGARSEACGKGEKRRELGVHKQRPGRGGDCKKTLCILRVHVYSDSQSSKVNGRSENISASR